LRLFQSAPRARARGDTNSLGAQIHLTGFQSAPRARARGDLANLPGYDDELVSIRAPRTRAGRQNPLRARDLVRVVSIRAPRTRAGRPGGSGLTATALKFQSAPRARARGDRFIPADVLAREWFQSAPRARARGDVRRLRGGRLC